MPTPRILLSWSSGKDSAWALQVLRRDPSVEVVALLTTLNQAHGRVAMHAVRERLLDLQAEAAGLPLWKVPLPWPCPDGAYEGLMAGVLERCRTEGIRAVAYGDLFLEDVRAYREARHAGTGIGTRFPLWGRPTFDLAREMVAGGLKAVLTCVDPRQLGGAFAGRDFDEALLADLPPSADPCGERGEFHTFAWDGPMFRHPVPVARGPVVERDGFVFADLTPEGEPASQGA
ncbi:MAG: hypothetical protein U0P81_03730 [Holophagaceae bacterium]